MHTAGGGHPRLEERGINMRIAGFEIHVSDGRQPKKSAKIEKRDHPDENTKNR